MVSVSEIIDKSILVKGGINVVINLWSKQCQQFLTTLSHHDKNKLTW